MSCGESATPPISILGQTAEEETMMAFPAFLSEVYEAFRRKVGADERPASVVPEAAVIEDTRFRSIDGKFDALSHTMDQRFDALSQPSDGLSRVLDQRFDALNHAMDQRFGHQFHAMDQRLVIFGHQMGQRFDALGRTIDDRFAKVDQQFVARDVRFAGLETKTATIAAMDVWLERLETKIATEFRYLRWGLGIVIALVLGLVTIVILDWLMP
jgi:hypothetical protein